MRISSSGIHFKGRGEEVTYIILVPHDIQECIQWQVEISSSKACKCTENASSEEHIVQMTLSVGQQLLDLRCVLWHLTHLVGLKICLIYIQIITNN